MKTTATLVGPGTLLLALLSTALLVACGGGGDDDDRSLQAAMDSGGSGAVAVMTAPLPAPARAAAPALPPALFDALGRPVSAPAPADPAARTRAGLYATAAQLEMQMLTAAPCTVLVDVQADDAEAARGAALAQARQALAGCPVAELAYFVRATGSPARARAVADALWGEGLGPVFAVL